jgi:hypothetical protein
MLARGPPRRYSVVPAGEGCKLLRRHWARLLEARVDGIMRGLA